MTMPASTKTTPQVPDVLYHYTTLGGIVAIAENAELWASDIRYMNDATEFSYAHDLLADELRTRAAAQPRDVRAVVETLLFDLSFASRQNSVNFMGSPGWTFVSCFSSNGDQLSQWRAYCPDGGYALGFRTRSLQILAREDDLDLKQCSYSPDTHRRHCEGIANDVIGRVLKLPKEVREGVPSDDPKSISFDILGELFPIRTHMLDEIQRHAPTWKHESFHEESEWRLVSRQRNRSTKFRPGRTAIIPYLAIPLRRKSLSTGDAFDVLIEVIVGPCPEPELAVSSAMHLLRENRIGFSSFSLSRTPFRSWR